MKIATIAAADSSLVNKEIQSSVYKLGFTFSGVAATNATPEVSPDLATLRTALFGNTEITLSRQDGSSNLFLINRLKLADVAEIATFNEGVIKVTRKYHATAGENKLVANFTIELGLGGAVVGSDDVKFILNIENKPVDVTVDIETIDYAVVSTNAVVIESKFVNGNTPTELSIVNHYALAMEAENLVTIEFRYSNGKSVLLTKSEFLKMMVDSQDLVYIVNNVPVVGYSKFAISNVEECYSAVVQMSQNSTLYVMKYQAV